MRSYRGLLSFAGLLILGVMPVSAAEQPADAVATCLIAHDKLLAEALIDLPFLEPQQVQAMGEAVRPCHEATPLPLVRVGDIAGQIARRLFLERFGADDAQAHIAGVGDGHALGPVNDVGECIVKAKPASAVALTVQARGSSADAASLEDLRAAALGCGWNPARLAEPAALRGLMLTSLYRLMAQGPRICQDAPKDAMAQKATCRATPLQKAATLRSITMNDYPVESRKRREEGPVAAVLEVGVNGRVTPGSCRVIASSGSPRLDARACELFEDRFRYHPALRNGQPVTDVLAGRFRWDLP